ncbi:hypothetical protein CEUSTIGMA_g10619.t1 [Chlamydomonas eustigma]|uniref:GATA-type domain-containing protein n=1 Tax=Chlamydomonas eustigma TaxID=1157962 RepID=A0A250XJI6_9CHLO|nr:hypothetical protein CEUSTIGMA_g10619.t1 [Chlamydomonas eustigma]|eukprot:GAX83193.1 hypothetical protein CEUSTIGMA_g10619.t1 [Chlamydomonas eustigma]
MYCRELTSGILPPIISLPFLTTPSSYPFDSKPFLSTESADEPYHIGCIQSAFTDCAPDVREIQCIEVRWFERFSTIYPSGRGVDKELVELEDVDVNPIGCLVGKANIIRAKSYEDALSLGLHLDGDWFFSRGIFKHATNEFVLYSDVEAGAVLIQAKSGSKRSSTTRAEEIADSEDACLSRPARALSKRFKVQRVCSDEEIDEEEEEVENLVTGPGECKKGFAKGPGKQCVECGATQTPQWREGPAGPKTLCNACGVRYNRLRSSKRNGGMGPRQQSARSKPSKHASSKDIATRALLEPSCGIESSLHATSGAGGGRPMRHAALMAANRTAAFARTGVFPLEERGGRGTVAPQHMEQQHLATLSGGGVSLQHLATLSGGGVSQQDEGSSHHSSESAEEHLFPLQHQHSAGGSIMVPQSGALLSAGSSMDDLPMLLESGPHPSPLDLDAMGVVTGPPALTPMSACAANATPCAVQQTGPIKQTGLSVFNQQSSTDLHQKLLDFKNGSVNVEAITPAATAAGNILRSVALRAVTYCPDVSEFGDVFASFESLRSKLPDHVVAQLLGVTEQVDSATNEAAAAEAALQAVVQVMASRQKAADAARQRAADAVDKLKGCMVEILQQHDSRLIGGATPSTLAGTSALIQDLGGLGSCASGGGLEVGKSMGGSLSCWVSQLDDNTSFLGDLNGCGMLDNGGDFGSSLLHQMDYMGFGGAELIEVNN